MAGFNAKIDMFEIRENFTVDMEKACRELMKNAARYWLIEILKRIPIRTGFLVGSFRGLEDYLGISGPRFGTFTGLRKNGKFVAQTPAALIKHFTTAKNKRLQLLEKQQGLEHKIRRLERAKTRVVDRAGHTGETKSAAGEFGAHSSEIAKEAAFGLSSREGGNIEKILERNARIDRRVQTLTKRLGRVTNFLDKVNKYDKGKYGRGQTDAIRELDDLRKQLRKLNTERGVTPHNPQIGHEKARYSKEYVDITRTVEPTNAEKIKALRTKQKIESRIEVIGTELKRFKIREEKRLYAFKEYYTHTDGSKTLKTPSSGVKFATDPEKAFEEFSTGELGLLQRLAAQAQSTQNYRDSQQPKANFIGSTDTEGEESTALLNDAFKASVVNDLYKRILNTKVFFQFGFQVSIRYFDINDYYRSGKGLTAQKAMPWGAQLAASQAFLTYLQHNALNKLPKIESLVGTTKVVFDGRTTAVTQRADIG